MLYESRGEIVQRGVIGRFRRLAWCYKTNQPQQFCERIVVTSINGYHGHSSNAMDDLLRYLHIMHGKREPDHRNGMHALLRSGGVDYAGRTGQVENDYLEIRVFKNQNGHVPFKRPELVDRMNLIIPKHFPGALPAPK